LLRVLQRYRHVTPADAMHWSRRMS
jgi:hypothetical protein